MAIKDHKLKSADDIYMFSRTGVVMGAVNWSDTYVSGGGGANNTNVSVSSNVVQRQKFFIRDADGRETEVNDAGLGVRDGHVVTVVYCGSQSVGDKMGWHVLYANQTTGNSTFERSNIATLSGQLTGCLLALAWIVVAACVISLFSPLLILGLPIGGFIGFWLFNSSKKSKTLARAIEAAARREVESARGEADALRQQQASPA